MVRTIFIFSFVLASSLHSAVPEASFRATNSGHSEAYNEGRTALRKRDWSTAVTCFERVIKAEEVDADGAYYWKAYALSKQKRKSEALAVIETLVTRFPESTWSRDARTLKLELGGEAALSQQENSDEDLIMVALSSLMLRPRDEAVLELKRFLAGDHSTEIKEKALFVLSQRGGTEAQDLIREIARGNQYPKLRKAAIQNLGIFRDAASLKILDEVYAESQDKNIKEAIIHSLIVARARDQLLAVFESETNRDLRVSAMRALSIIGGSAKLEKLYQAQTEPARKTEILEAIVPGTKMKTFFLEVYRTGSSEDREIALRNLGFSKDCDLLGQLYDEAEEVELKKQVLEAMLLATCDRLQEVFHSEKDPELRAQALRGINLRIRPPISFLLEVYRDEASREIRKQVLEGLFLRGAAKELVNIARVEKDEELRLAAVRNLSLMRKEEARAYMQELLGN